MWFPLKMPGMLRMGKSRRLTTVLAMIAMLALLMASPAFAGGRGDNFNHPIGVAGVGGPNGIPYTDVRHTNKNATTQPGEPDPRCASSFSRTIWYVFTPSITEQYFADTVGSDFDTFLAIYSNDGSGFLLLDCDNDSGGAHGGASGTSWQQTQTLVSGTAYYFQVGSNDDASGHLVFNLND